MPSIVNLMLVYIELVICIKANNHRVELKKILY
mgnify:CR=1 FL=1|jgi:hypothetical protein